MADLLPTTPETLARHMRAKDEAGRRDWEADLFDALCAQVGDTAASDLFSDACEEYDLLYAGAEALSGGEVA